LFSQETEFRIDLRFGQANISFGKYDIDIGFVRAELYLDLDGIEVCPGQRYADHVVEPMTKTAIQHTEKDRISSGSQRSTAGNVSSLPSLNAQYDFSSNVDREVQLSSERNFAQFRIKAGPNNVWVMKGEEGKPLDASYLTSDTVLCRLRPAKGANRNVISVYVISRKRDIWYLEPDGQNILTRTFHSNINKEKIFKILLAKSIGNKAPDSSDKILISKLSNSDD
jgi:hypothetical protein